MSTTSYGPGTKKETVYGGLPPGTTGTVYGGPPVPGTVGTVYQGPTPGGTVYQGTKPGGPAVRRIDTSVQVRKAGALFYYIAAISLINTLLALVSAKYAMAMGLGTMRAFDASSQAQITAVLVTNALIAGIFFAIGMFARKGSSVAFLIGILLYGLDLVLLCADFSRHVPAVAVHGYFIYKMISALRELRS